MISTSKRLRRAIMGMAALAVVASAVPLSDIATAAPLVAGDPPAAAATLVPPAGNNTTLYNLAIPALSSCPGDGPAGYRWQTYIVPAATDIATMTWDGSGNPLGPPFSQALRNPSGTLVRNQLPGIGNGLIAIPPAGFSWVGVAPPAGEYNIGIACTKNDGDPVTPVIHTEKYFNQKITVTSTGVGTFDYATGIAPAAPVLASPLTVGAGATSVSGSFTAASSDPATTGYTVTATPTAPAGTALTFPVATAGVFTLTGLTPATTYDVTVTATNDVGTSVPSNTVSVTTVVGAQPPIPLGLTPGTGQITASFQAPGAPAPAPTGYTLTVAPAPGGTTPASFTFGAGIGPFTQVVSDLTPGTTYTFTLTPEYAAPDSGTPSTNTASPNAAQVIQQRITVTRPVGTLILTQRCGVYGALPAFTAVDAFPGYPLGLPAETATTDQIGTTPDIDLTTSGLQNDPQFGSYPFPSPATYPTECGIALGSASLVTTGALAGQYYAAAGRLNEVTVADTRDTDSGWIVTGTMSDFVGTVSASNTFDGDYLGWDPEVQNVTPPTTTGYTQVVNAGGPVLPGTGVVSGSGLGSGQTLATAPLNKGLGVAQLDARVQLLIPTAADNDDYVGILGFTVV